MNMLCFAASQLCSALAENSVPTSNLAILNQWQVPTQIHERYASNFLASGSTQRDSVLSKYEKVFDALHRGICGNGLNRLQSPLPSAAVRLFMSTNRLL